MDCCTPGLPVHHKFSDSCALSQWCHPTISPSVVLFSFHLQSFPALGSFQMSHRWPKYWSFSFNISPSSEYSGLISFRMDWLDLLAVQGALKLVLQNHSSKASFHGAIKIDQITNEYHFVCICVNCSVVSDCSPLGSSVHGILQAIILEWIAIPFSRGSSWPRDRTQVIREAWIPPYLSLIYRNMFRLKLKKLGKATRPFKYDLNQTLYDYTVDVRNRFKGLDLIECLKNYGPRFMTLYKRQWSRPSPRKRNAKRQNGCLRRPYK